MSSTLSEDTFAALKAASTGDPAVALPFDATEAEHIYIDGDSLDADRSPGRVAHVTRIRNFARGVATELTFYEEGFLRVRQGTRKRLEKDHTLDIRFVDPKANVSRKLSVGWLWTSIGLAALAISCILLLPLTGLSQYATPVVTVLGTAACLAFLQVVYRSEERFRFVTASGRVQVLQLVASLGCISKVRNAVKRLRRHIAACGGAVEAPDQRYLREEMQVHYRLRETGVISRGDCSSGTARILSRFD